MKNIYCGVMLIFRFFNFLRFILFNITSYLTIFCLLVKIYEVLTLRSRSNPMNSMLFLRDFEITWEDIFIAEFRLLIWTTLLFFGIKFMLSFLYVFNKKIDTLMAYYISVNNLISKTIVLNLSIIFGLFAFYHLFYYVISLELSM